MTEHFIIYAAVVDVYTENNPLVYVFSSVKLNATRQRWVNQLEYFNLNLHYKPGKINIEADNISTNIASHVDIDKLIKNVTETKADTLT